MTTNACIRFVLGRCDRALRQALAKDKRSRQTCERATVSRLPSREICCPDLLWRSRSEVIEHFPYQLLSRPALVVFDRILLFYLVLIESCILLISSLLVSFMDAKTGVIFSFRINFHLPFLVRKIPQLD